MGDRSWAKEPASVPWAQRNQKEREWRVRGELCLCSLSTPCSPPHPQVSPYPAPGGSFCAPGSLLSPRRPRRPHCTPTSQPLAPKDSGCETRPAGRPRGREAQSRVGGVAPTRSYLEWPPRREALRGSRLLSARLHGTLACGRGAGRQARRVRSRSSAPGVSRIVARAKLTGVGAARGARRGQEAIDPVLATVPFIRAAGRQSRGGERQSKVPREPAGVGRRGRAGAAGRAALWARGQRRRGVPA